MNINDLIRRKKVLISDGAMGTELMKKGLPPGYCPELWNEENPAAISAVSASYIAAGSDIILTNTFGASSIKLSKYGLENRSVELNKAGVEAAKQAAAGKDVMVFGSIGPTGEFLEPLGELTEAAMSEAFARQIDAMASAGADGLVFETMMSIEEAVCGLKAAKKISSLPVVVSLAYDRNDKGFATMMGVTPEKAVKELTANGADIIGANCGISADAMLELTKTLKGLTNLPLWIKPNAGAPQNVSGKTVYNETPGSMSSAMQKIVSAGASIVGGCCGTTPEHIKALRRGDGS
ncbi:MAG: hypothetical protein A2297_06145 [Elusimicrobia bacterium RIFOXYB2_FULL_48_7]|nr:MAG: hypothetical protein A2297_06145 [Elusimicrobia bacterium RIFOXYB2_FULL_48_7]